MVNSTIQIRKLTSERKSIEEVEPILRAFQSEIGFDEIVYHNVLIAITEAINNAIIHGNKLDKSKTVTFSYCYNDSELIFTIEDEGGGFDPLNIPDPRKEENLLRTHGRGVFIIQNLAFKSEYVSSDKGTKLTIHFQYKSQ